MAGGTAADVCAVARVATDPWAVGGLWVVGVHASRDSSCGTAHVGCCVGWCHARRRHVQVNDAGLVDAGAAQGEAQGALGQARRTQQQGCCAAVLHPCAACRSQEVGGEQVLVGSKS